MENRLREAGALAEALRERLDQPVAHRLQAALLDGRLDALSALGAAVAADGGDEVEEGVDAHPGVARGVLGQVAEAALGLDGILLHAEAADRGRTRGRGQEARDHAHGRRLARSVGPEESQHFTLLNGEGDAPNRLDRTKVAFQVANGQHPVSPLFARRHAGRGRPCRPRPRRIRHRRPRGQAENMLSVLAESMPMAPVYKGRPCSLTLRWMVRRERPSRSAVSVRLPW